MRAAGQRAAGAAALLLLLVPFGARAGDEVDERSGVGLRLATAGGRLRLRLGGSLMLDAAAIEGEESPTENDAEIRRARVAAALDLDRRWQVRLSYELAGRKPGWRSAWLGWESDGRRFRVGQFQQPFGLDELSGSSELTFVERALPNLFSPSYRLGGEARWGRRSWSLAGAAFRGDLDESGADRLGLAARWTMLATFGKRHRLHLGLAAQLREPSDGLVRFRSRPENSLAPVLVDTGRIHDVRSLAGTGIELAVQSGRLLVQGEAVAMRLSRDRDRSDADLGGAYLAASWTLSGEPRRYRHGSGSFGAVRGRGRAWGWELAARFSLLDLTDDAVRGGKLADWTVGVSAAWGEWGRLLLDVVHGEARRRGRSETVDAVILQLQLRR